MRPGGQLVHHAFASDPADAAVGHLLDEDVLAESDDRTHHAGQRRGARELAIGRGLLVDASGEEDGFRGEGGFHRGDRSLLGCGAHSEFGFFDPDRGSHSITPILGPRALLPWGARRRVVTVDARVRPIPDASDRRMLALSPTSDLRPLVDPARLGD